jgi:hypothetical protein
MWRWNISTGQKCGLRRKCIIGKGKIIIHEKEKLKQWNKFIKNETKYFSKKSLNRSILVYKNTYINTK